MNIAILLLSQGAERRLIVFLVAVLVGALATAMALVGRRK
jgi:hypothetical protein